MSLLRRALGRFPLIARSLWPASREPNQGGEVENSSPGQPTQNRHRRTPGMPCIHTIPLRAAGWPTSRYHTTSTALDLGTGSHPCAVVACGAANRQSHRTALHSAVPHIEHDKLVQHPDDAIIGKAPGAPRQPQGDKRTADISTASPARSGHLPGCSAMPRRKFPDRGSASGLATSCGRERFRCAARWNRVRDQEIPRFRIIWTAQTS